MITIRQADISDIQQIQSVASAAWLATYQSFYSLDFIQAFLRRAYSDESLLQSIERDKRQPVPLILVAVREDGGLIGYGHVQLDDAKTAAYELMRLYVHPDHQRSGAGTLLFERYLTTLTSMQCLFAWVEKENRIGRDFYEKKGFAVAEEMLETMLGHSTLLLRYELKRG
ncbi:GNAT family N-acetyltransferase [Cohnella lubricantis]|uniref:GNAT family N-acetyltransferase n=1 Tax=Cohnella lubricantis TaxID=2163172 RepID=A0A841TF22_9BACL|nr:GNAT family N-acetyltransferase [Cohnella lubricantis]MBB6677820.1 GNAT family N-acetyltransferase [Cohnella lubricantis]MBP2120505.1 N-acetylglutamate synthase-like GNAT family acetyltransferase [Cohnella lubricantis]